MPSMARSTLARPARRRGDYQRPQITDGSFLRIIYNSEIIDAGRLRIIYNGEISAFNFIPTKLCKNSLSTLFF